VIGASGLRGLGCSPQAAVLRYFANLAKLS